MTEAQETEPKTLTREELFPEGWNKSEPEKASPVDTSDEQPEDDTEEQLAEAQDEERTEEPEPERSNGHMRLNRFFKEAGWELNDAYHSLMVERDGKEISISQALDEGKALQAAHDALLRERQALQEQLNQQATTLPTQGVSPEAQALMSQAQIYNQALTTTDWSQIDPGQAANQKMDLQLEIQRLQGQASAKQLEYQNELADKIAKARSEADRQTRARIPEWSDGMVMQSERRAIADMMNAYGLTQAEVETIVDPRVWHMLRDAQKAMADGKRIAEGAKKVRKVSKTLAAGNRSTQPKRKLTPEQMREQIKRAQEKGGKQGAQAARLAMEFDIPAR